MKKIYWYLLIIAGIMIIGYFAGVRIAGILGAIAVLFGGKSQYDKAKEKVDKAGDDIEAEHFDNADSAAEYVDNVLSNISKRDTE